jgi:hypothetical protein
MTTDIKTSRTLVIHYKSNNIFLYKHKIKILQIKLTLQLGKGTSDIQSLSERKKTPFKALFEISYEIIKDYLKNKNSNTFVNTRKQSYL